MAPILSTEKRGTASLKIFTFSATIEFTDEAKGDHLSFSMCFHSAI